MSALRQPYNVGELDQRVELQKETHTSDGMGGATSAWVTQDTVWAHVRAQRGNERLQSDRVEAEGGYLVIIRNRSDIDFAANWRIVWRGKAMNARFPQDNGPRPLYLAIECSTGVAT